MDLKSMLENMNLKLNSMESESNSMDLESKERLSNVAVALSKFIAGAALLTVFASFIVMLISVSQPFALVNMIVSSAGVFTLLASAKTIPAALGFRAKVEEEKQKKSLEKIEFAL